ncbi:MAG: transporter substrate-binding domain-containing protein [Spirochaetia bacterium]|nr:transporter substrate-binding domain-containing protein [Spirochaetia bacterium]
MLLVALSLAVYAGGQQDSGAEGGKETITVGVNSENPPWVFADDGTITGFEADIIEEFAKRAGYKIEYKGAPFFNGTYSVDPVSGMLQCPQSGLKRSELKLWTSADPYYDSGIGMMTREDGFTDFKDVKGKVFGSDTGSMNEAWLIEAWGESGPYQIKSYDYWVDAAARS